MNLRRPRFSCWMCRCLSGAMIAFWPSLSKAQLSKTLNTLKYETEAGGALATSRQTPFWLRTNQYGTVPLQSSFLTLSAGIRREYGGLADTTRKKRMVDWGFGANGVFNAVPSQNTKTAELLWPEVYGKIKLGPFEIYGGKRRELYGFGDSTLSSGFMAWSGNAMPFPKIQWQTIGFVPLKFLKSILSFNAGYAHGWFTVPYIQRAYLHQKHLYIRFGKPHWSVRFYAGLNHQVQWGGKADYLIGSPVAENGQLPTAFRDYLSLVTGRYPDDYSNDRYNSFDGANRIGNHLGSYDFALEWKDKQRNLLFYHQHPYEDASGLAFENFPDGLTGLRLLRLPAGSAAPLQLRRLVMEYLQTTDQSGEIFITLARYQGNDSYFNHGQYKEGWSYDGRTIGTPFIAPVNDFQPGTVPAGNKNYFPNNRVLMWYLGSEWTLFRKITLLSRSSFSRNFGLYGQAFSPPLRQFSCLLSAKIPISRWAGCSVKGNFALDQGKLFPASFGSFISLQKIW
ncbi:MAG: capsule assembly Wzi family protein [Spirosomataceae bacterium]